MVCVPKWLHVERLWHKPLESVFRWVMQILATETVTHYSSLSISQWENCVVLCTAMVTWANDSVKPLLCSRWLSNTHLITFIDITPLSTGFGECSQDSNKPSWAWKRRDGERNFSWATCAFLCIKDFILKKFKNILLYVLMKNEGPSQHMMTK